MNDTPLVHLAHTLEELPRYAFELLITLLTTILSDPIVTSWTIGCVCVALVTNTLIALAVFFLLYTVIRTINTVANAIGITGQRLAPRHSVSPNPGIPPE